MRHDPPHSIPSLTTLLAESDAEVFNFDKCGYASDLTSIEALITAHRIGVSPRSSLRRLLAEGSSWKAIRSRSSRFRSASS